MISSAVIIPEQQHLHHHSNSNITPSPTSLKRKFSSSYSNDRKRSRVDTGPDTLDYDDAPAPKRPTPETDRHEQLSTPASSSSTPASPSRQRSSNTKGDLAHKSTKHIDEKDKKRNQRLFSGLLGTLAQAPSLKSGPGKKREEIEAKQRERLRLQKAEEESERQRRKEELEKRRKIEQKKWDQEGTEIRREMMRMQAGFLKTKAEPRLFYLPWELRDSEKELVEGQREDVEKVIRTEMGNDEEDEMGKQQRGGHGDSARTTAVEAEGNLGSENLTLSHDGEKETEPQHGSMGNGNVESLQNEKTDSETEREPQPRGQASSGDGRPDELLQKADEHDEHGEELVEGQEDDVIY